MAVLEETYSAVRRVKTDENNYQRLSEWTLAKDVECADGKTVEERLEEAATLSEIPYATWKTLSNEEKEEAGDVLVTDVPSNLVFVEPETLEELQNKVANSPSSSDVYGTDEFSLEKTYATGDMCIWDNRLYECIVTCVGIYPTNTTYWKEISLSALNSNVEHLINNLNKQVIKYGTTSASFVKGEYSFAHNCGFTSKDSYSFIWMFANNRYLPSFARNTDGDHTTIAGCDWGGTNNGVISSFTANLHIVWIAIGY